jgi:hypothetical protein
LSPKSITEPARKIPLCGEYEVTARGGGPARNVYGRMHRVVRGIVPTENDGEI